MGELQYLISRYSMSEVVIVILCTLAAVKAIYELVNWFVVKAHKKFDEKNEQAQWREVQAQFQNDMRGSLETINASMTNIASQLEEIKNRTTVIENRLQDDTRVYILDKYRRFTKDLGWIDELSMEDLERRYNCYKKAGGDSYIDGVMQEIRELHRYDPDRETTPLGEIKE